MDDQVLDRIADAAARLYQRLQQERSVAGGSPLFVNNSQTGNQPFEMVKAAMPEIVRAAASATYSAVDFASLEMDIHPS